MIDHPWFAVRTQRNHERVTVDRLRDKHVETFLPEHLVRRRWRSRSVTLKQPLFPGYLFVRVAFSRRMDVASTPGVCEILSNGHQPMPVPDNEIEAVKRIVLSDRLHSVQASFPQGARVRIEVGPLTGLTGTVCRNNQGVLVAISMSVLGQSVVANIDAAELEVIG